MGQLMLSAAEAFKFTVLSRTIACMLSQQEDSSKLPNPQPYPQGQSTVWRANNKTQDETSERLFICNETTHYNLFNTGLDTAIIMGLKGDRSRGL